MAKRTSEQERLFHRNRMRKRNGYTGKRQTCGKCSEPGHNKATCPMRIEIIKGKRT